MTGGWCPDCGRPRASAAEWKAGEEQNVGRCSGCAWGRDLCWSFVPCGASPASVAHLIQAARDLRAGREWADVDHWAEKPGAGK